MLGQRRLALVMKRASVQESYFQGRKIFRVQPGRQEVDRSLAGILDLQPERLDAALVEVDADARRLAGRGVPVA